MNEPEKSANSSVARSCNDESDATPDRDPPCFPVSPDDSSRIVTAKRAECNPAGEAPAEPPPATSEDAIKVAIKLAVDAGEYERAAALLDVAKRTTKPGRVTPIDSARGRDR
jgi:hypothetical protein